MNIFCPNIYDRHIHISICSDGAKNHQAGLNFWDFFVTLLKFHVLILGDYLCKKTRGNKINEKEENQEIECFVWRHLTLNFLYRKLYRTIYNVRK